MTLRITPERLSALFRPRSVALVGASNKSIFSALATRNLVEFGFSDRMHLVNRRGAQTHELPTITSIAEIEGPVDVAFLMVPRAGTLDALTEAAAAGIRNAVVLSSGYGETGRAGRQAEAELVAHAESLDMLLLGPNHLGFVNFTDRIPVAAIPQLPQTSGPVALLSQSGGSASQMLTFAAMCDIGLSYAVTLGNEAMISAGHVLEYLVEDESTRAIALFLETIREPEVFRRAAERAAVVGKPLIVYKVGRSQLAARTAAAHTGALVGDDRTIDAVFRSLGVIRIDSVEDMLLTANACARLGRLPRPGIGVVSVSGGACDMVADTAQEFGAEIPEFAPGTVARLTEILPDYGTAQNPLDTPGGILDPSIFARTIEAVSEDPSVGVVAVVQTIPWVSDGTPYLRQVLVNATGEGIARSAVPAVVINQVLQPITDYSHEIMAAGNVPYVLPGLRHGVMALGRLAWWSDATRSGRAAIPVEPVALTAWVGRRREGAWSEWESRQLLEAAGIPVVPGRLATDPGEAVAAAAELGHGPMALKIVSPDILHKSDVGGVRLAVSGDAGLRRAFQEIVEAGSAVAGSRIDGVLVTPMRPGGIELLVGVVRDPAWGPMLAVALGGILVEALDDSGLAPLPVSPDQARSLIRGLRAARVLDGGRGRPPADLERLAEVVARIGAVAGALGENLESLEVNPLRVDGAEVEALDAVVTWRPRENRLRAGAGRREPGLRALDRR